MVYNYKLLIQNRYYSHLIAALVGPITSLWLLAAARSNIDGSQKETSDGYQCENCGKVFAYRYYRDKHMKYTRCIDHGDRQFPCQLCNRCSIRHVRILFCLDEVDVLLKNVRTTLHIRELGLYLSPDSINAVSPFVYWLRSLLLLFYMFYILVFTLIHCILQSVLLSLYPCVSVMWKLNFTYLLTYLGDLVINPAVDWHYFPLGPRSPFLPQNITVL